MALAPRKGGVGRRAYGIYLLHVLCVWGVDGAISSDSIPVVGSAVVYLVAFLASIAAADVFYRLIERPGVGVGHKLSAKILGVNVVRPSPVPKAGQIPASA